MRKFKNDPELTRLVCKELRALIRDLEEGNQNILDSWNHYQFDFKLWTREMQNAYDRAPPQDVE